MKWKFVATEDQKLPRISVLGEKRKREIPESHYLIKDWVNLPNLHEQQPALIRNTKLRMN